MENRESLGDIQTPEDVSDAPDRKSESSGMKGEGRHKPDSDLGSEDISPKGEKVEWPSEQ